MGMTLKSIFINFYKLNLEAGSGGRIITRGLESLPDDRRKEVERWLDSHKDYALERIVKDK